MKSLSRFLPCFLLVALAPFAPAQEAAPIAAGPPSTGFSGYIGGVSAESVQAMAVDKDGSVWVAGSSSSAFDFPGPNDPYQSTITGRSDVFLAKYRVETDGTATVLFWTWIGGTGDEDVRAMAIDSNGRIYLTGATNSSDFPYTGTPFQSANAGGTDAYVLLLDPSIPGHESLVFSSYYGGTGNDVPTAMALDPVGGVYITGYTNSPDLPNVSGNLQGANRGGYEAFFIKVALTGGDTLKYATFLGGTSTDVATGIAVDQAGVVWIAGYTSSTDFPTAGNAYNATFTAPSDAFLVALDLTKPGLDALVYGTYFGGSDLDVPTGLAIDTDGSLWLSGYTLSKDFPVTGNAVQRNFGGVADGFVTRLDMTQSPDKIVTYSTYLGGNDGDILYAFTLLGGGKFAVAGYTMSGDFPVAGPPVQATPKSAFAESFVAKVDSNVAGPAGLLFSSYFGGDYSDIGTCVAADAAGSLYLGGYTNSDDLPVTDGSFKQSPNPLTAGFLVKIN